MAPEICIFTGPMFAGKTSAIINCWNATELPKYAFKYSNDSRYETNITNNNGTGQMPERQIVSHNETKLPAIGISKCTEINNYISQDEPKIVIFIDEGQFLQDIHQWIFDFAPKNIKQIYVSGLDYDIFGNKFSEEFSNLIECATECHTLTAKCFECQEPASYTQFIDNNSMPKLNGNILIGGSEQYQPVCRNHFKPISSNQSNNN
jgi:thymidine kinase